MVWAADISLQAICQSELDALIQANLASEFLLLFHLLFDQVHMCALNLHYVTLHSPL